MKEFKKNGEYIVLDVPYAEAYIPSDIIGDITKGGNHVAYEYGDGFRSIGLFNIRFYKSDMEDRESTKLRTFNYPNMITMYPTDLSKTETLRLEPDMPEMKYRILKFYTGDIIMSTKIQKLSSNCESFMNMLIKGKLPKGISYIDLYFAWQKNFEINGINPGVPSIILQTIISENCRSKEDASVQFRKALNRSKTLNLTDYSVSNMVDICSNNSVMNALTFERFSDMLTYSLNMSKSGVKQNISPLEEVLTM